MGGFWVEVVGFIGTAIVLVSFMMKDIDTLRIVGIVGSVFFICYGYLTHTQATIVVNVLVISLNIYQLYRKKK
jgi:hypothetical protein